MSSEIRWAVLRDKYPFGIGEALGIVTAPDRAAALSIASAQFDGKVVVQSVASRTSALRELFLPAPDPRRADRKRFFAQQWRARVAAAKRAALRSAVAGDAPK